MPASIEQRHDQVMARGILREDDFVAFARLASESR